MGATAFLRHRRAVAAKYVRDKLAGDPELAGALARKHGLELVDLGTLEGNNDVLAMADDLAGDLTKLEVEGAVDLGPRNLEAIDGEVRDDQYHDRLQHPKAETVGVGNMHDGPEHADNALNVAGVVVDAFDGDRAAAAGATAGAIGDALATHGDLLPGAGGAAPAGSITDPKTGKPVTVTGTSTGAPLVEGPQPLPPQPATTGLDVHKAAKEVAARQAGDEKLVEFATDKMLADSGRDALMVYAEKRKIALPEDPKKTMSLARIRAAIKRAIVDGTAGPLADEITSADAGREQAAADDATITEAQLEGMDVKAMRALAAERGLSIPTGGSPKPSTVRAHILRALAAKSGA